jgi:nitrite reductase (NADH) small subunit
VKRRVIDRDALAIGEKRQVEVTGRAIVIGRISEDEWFALRDICPHQGAALSRGLLVGTCPPTNAPGEHVYERCPEIIRCPWHSWEFDVRTGRNIYMPDSRFRVKTYEVSVEPDGIFVDI